MLVVKLLPTLLFGVRGILADGTAIVSAVTSIQSATNGFTAAVAGWTGDAVSAIPIITQSTAALAAINRGTTSALLSNTLTTTEATGVGTAIVALVGSIKTSLDTLVASKPKFDKILLSPSVILTLEQEKAEYSAFSASVFSKFPDAFAATGQQLAAQITAEFDGAISSYSGGMLKD